MMIRVSDEKKLVEVWLTRSEHSNQAANEALRKLCKPYAEKKYTVVYFTSGQADLYDQTLELLRYNKRRSAQVEVEEQKKAQQVS